MFAQKNNKITKARKLDKHKPKLKKFIKIFHTSNLNIIVCLSFKKLI